MNESIEWYWLWRPRDFVKQLNHDIAEERLWTLLGSQLSGIRALSSRDARSLTPSVLPAIRQEEIRSPLTIASER